MALTVGELVAYAQLDKSDFTSGTRAIGSDLTRLQSSTSSSMASMESTVTKSLAEIERSIADGLDPSEAIRDLDRLEAALDAGLDEMLAETDQFAAELDAAIDEAFDRLDDDAQASGKKAGDELVDGLRAGVRDAERVAREAGEDAGREFGDGVEGAGGGGRMSGIADNLVGGLKTAGVGLALAAGAAIGAALMSGLEAAMDAEKATQKLFAQIGASEGEMKTLGNVAGQVYADGYGESIGDVTEAIKGVIQNVDGIRGASEESLGTLSKRAIDTGAILDEDVSKVTRAIAKILKTDLAGSADEAFDILVRGAQLGGNEAEDLLDTYSEYSTQFRTLGLSGQQAMGLIVQGLQAGARDADVVADAIKEFTIEAVQGGDNVKRGFKDLGLSADDMVAKFAAGGPTAAAAFDTVLDKLRNIEDPAKRNAVAVELFGTKAEDLGQALFSLDPSAAVNTLGAVDGAAKKAGDTLNDTASHKLEAFKRGLEQNVVNFLGGTVLPGIEDFATKAAEGIRSWVEDNQATVDEWKAKFEEGFGHISEIVDDVLTTIKELWDEYGDEIITSVTWLIDTFLSVWNAFWGVVSGLFKTIKGILTGDFEEMKEGLSAIWDSLWGLAEDIVTNALKAITGFMGESWEDMKSQASEAWENLKTKISDGVSNAVTTVQKLPDKVKAVFSDAGTWLMQAGKDVIRGFVNGIKAMASAPVDAVRTIMSNVTGGAQKELDQHSPSKVFEDIGINTMLGFIGGVVAKGKEVASTIAKMMDDAVVSTAKQATGTGGGGGGGGGGARPSTVMAEIGKYTVKGLLDGLTSEGANIKSVVDKLVKDIKEGFKSTPDVVDGLLDFVKTGNKNLEDLALQREALVQRLADAKEYAKKVAGSAQEWASITGLKPEELMGAGDMASELQDKARSINDFANNIQKLAKMGLNKKVLQDIIDAGVEKGATFAEMLVGSDGAEIKALNKAQAAVDRASKKLGKASADAMYDTGKKAGEGYLKGLEESLKDLDKAMEKIVKALVAAIKKELKIKSPSQVMAEIGVFTMAGLIEGMQSMESSTIGAMAGLVGRAVSATSDAAIGSVGKAAAATTKIGINTAGGSLTGGGGAKFDGPLISPGSSVPAGGGITVNMPNAVIREEADVHALGREFGFEVAVQA
ncbi:phage tail tape measure protein [Streptosporangium canum]|uniref:phage tail tape measure protein n=1 Tax=Streptosporangium canum TaxID=324952 RepID=UPI00341B9913